MMLYHESSLGFLMPIAAERDKEALAVRSGSCPDLFPRTCVKLSDGERSNLEIVRRRTGGYWCAENSWAYSAATALAATETTVFSGITWESDFDEPLELLWKYLKAYANGYSGVIYVGQETGEWYGMADCYTQTTLLGFQGYGCDLISSYYSYVGFVVNEAVFGDTYVHFYETNDGSYLYDIGHSNSSYDPTTRPWWITGWTDTYEDFLSGQMCKTYALDIPGGKVAADTVSVELCPSDNNFEDCDYDMDSDQPDECDPLWCFTGSNAPAAYYSAVTLGADLLDDISTEEELHTMASLLWSALVINGGGTVSSVYSAYITSNDYFSVDTCASWVYGDTDRCDDTNWILEVKSNDLLGDNSVHLFPMDDSGEFDLTDEMDEFSYDYDPSERPWFVQAIARHQEGWTPIYSYADYNVLGLTFAGNQYSSDVVIGVDSFSICAGSGLTTTALLVMAGTLFTIFAVFI
ncbi:hypothetical protein Pelo_8243 [Pelomyxa schiedti]|nr:hypothetical protein Pelo_8243 [Pelomyxa schiedti]